MKDVFIACLGFFACFVPVAEAFYNWEDSTSDGNASLLLRGFTVTTKYEEDSAVDEKENNAAGGLARLIFDSKNTSGLAWEFNTYQTWIDKSLVSLQQGITTSFGVERSGLLEWSQSDTEYAHLAIDRMNIRWSGDSFNFITGRQAINLATTFFFSPNDFFAPFAAQTFYRVYKPGVDAIRAGWSLGELTSLEIIGVAGYQPDPDAKTGWSDDPDSSRDSWLVRYVTNLTGFEWALLMGKVRRQEIQGASVSGELFDWLGVRMEGHVAEELDGEPVTRSFYTIGFEHRWNNSLMMQFEQYYHGAGATEFMAYNGLTSYPARRYQAFGLSYEFTPLWTGQFSLIYNQIDHSLLSNFNFLHSYSDETEISLGLSLPEGNRQEGGKNSTQYGVYPKLLNLEIRTYF
ncbi:MAG: hypothetical protein OEY52_08305 [Gammaproteobacteria bacterium]|nr:hypothetical protein [Gammaproteobacteria bacterium]